MPAADSSLSRCASTLDETSPQRDCSSRKVGTGLARSSHSTRSAQRLPSRSSSAITGLPVWDPRTGAPGSGSERDAERFDFRGGRGDSVNSGSWLAQVLRLEHEVFEQRLVLDVRLVLDGAPALALDLFEVGAVPRCPGELHIVGDHGRAGM